MENVELKELILEICDEIKIIYSNAVFNIIGMSTVIVTDRRLLKQMIRNIIENAVKYSGKDEVDIILAENDNGKKLLIKDYGVGISKEDLNKIFVRFYRGDISRNKKNSGHGLGLNIVKTISEILNIELEVKSIPLKETIFILKF